MGIPSRPNCRSGGCLSIRHLHPSRVAVLARVLPEGRPLPTAVWRRRHVAMLILLWAHSLAIIGIATLGGSGLSHSLIEGAVPASMALLARLPRRSRRFRSTAASLGLVSTSAILVHLSGGNIEMHFHFFVIIAVITLYQDWMPFLFAIGFVTLHHGIVGVVDPSAVYNHEDAWLHPWKWAAIHGGFVLAASVAGVVNWRLNEGARALTDLVLNAAGEGIYVLDAQRRTVFLNPASGALLGSSITALVDRTEGSLVATRSMDASASPGDLVLREGVARHAGSTVFRRTDGTEFPADFVATPLIERGRVTGAVVTFNDISDRIEAEEALRNSEGRFRMLFASNPHPMWVYDIDTLAFLEVNEAAVRQYGYTRSEFLAMRISAVAPAEDIAYLATQRSGSGPAEQLAGKSRHRRRSGELFSVSLTAHPIEFAGRRGALVVAEDISERLRFEEQLAHQALHDPLTGLPNRALFTDRLAHAVAATQRADTTIAVLFLDLDGFKVVNDSLGHGVGDQLLVTVGERLARAVRPEDTVARFGGDEFLILLQDAGTANDAADTAERLLAALTPGVQVAEREVFVTASIGIAMHTPATVRLHSEDLVREADIAMYQAKAAGKARAVLFDAGMQPPAVERLELETDLRHAVERNEFVLHFQPEVHVQTGALVGMEALVRWQHPRRGLVPPDEFIPVAEETGLIIAIGEWVLRAACQQAQEWRRLYPSGPSLVMGVNLSARQLAQPTIVKDVAAILRETGLPAHCLRLEITESAAMQGPASTIAALHELRGLGAELAIDDFGTGYSSLSYLRSLPVNILKVDRSFLRAIAHDPSAVAIVRAIIAVAHTLSMEVTAEGIETGEQLREIAALQCDRGQGYYFARPLTADAAGRLLDASDSATSPHEAA